MALDIHAFRAIGLPQGGARPSEFEIFFPALPPGLTNNQSVSETLVRAKSATLPRFEMSTIDVYYQGRPIKVFGERRFVPWTVRFYNEIDFDLRDFFEAWNNMMNTMVGNQVQNSENILAIDGGYKVDSVRVRQLSKRLTLLRSYEFFGMYPELVGDIELDWETTNRIETFDVQFQYDYFIPSTADSDQENPGTYDVFGVNDVSAASGQGAIVTPTNQGRPVVTTVSRASNA
jgi:hypothetical protein